MSSRKRLPDQAAGPRQCFHMCDHPFGSCCINISITPMNGRFLPVRKGGSIRTDHAQGRSLSSNFTDTSTLSTHCWACFSGRATRDPSRERVGPDRETLAHSFPRYRCLMLILSLNPPARCLVQKDVHQTRSRQSALWTPHLDESRMGGHRVHRRTVRCCRFSDVTLLEE